MANVRLAITCGDPSGVGPEIIEKWLESSVLEDAELSLIGPRSWLSKLKSALPFSRIGVGDEGFCMSLGCPSKEGARIGLLAMEEAAQGCLVGKFDAVVTAPVSKNALQEIGFPFPGQSEFFANCWKGEPTMAFTGGRLRVVLATWHIPLQEVSMKLNSVLIERAVQRADWLCRAEGVVLPRIGICGLNPHAGEQGLLGKEEMEWIDPCLEELRKEYREVSLCQPADTLFARALEGEFDVIVALYHDQGLAPLKTIDFHEAVNVTLGLPFIRTSPDHGTAFGIAGKGTARQTSFKNAVDLAIQLTQFRLDEKNR
jgi:4-hydroxythreonine-4-phosphate dehydrogenase